MFMKEEDCDLWVMEMPMLIILSFNPPKNASPTNLPPCITKFNQCHITKDGYIHIKMGENVCGLAKRPVCPVLDIYM